MNDDSDIALDAHETTWLVNFTLAVMTGSVLLAVTSVTLALYVLLS